MTQNSCWNGDPAARRVAARGTYIAVSGNTGAGKSTLVSALAQALQPTVSSVVSVNERSLHHPLLQLMFQDPPTFAYGIQLNFLLQRHLCLLRWLSLGYVVVIERSHLDDCLFMETHLAQANISQAEMDAYQQLAHVLFQRIQDPDILVYIDVPPEISMHRLEQAELSGERPREFPNDVVKERFVHAWYRKYYQHIQQLKSDAKAGKRFQHTAFIDLDGRRPTAECVHEVLSILPRLDLSVWEKAHE